MISRKTEPIVRKGVVRVSGNGADSSRKCTQMRGRRIRGISVQIQENYTCHLPCFVRGEGKGRCGGERPPERPTAHVSCFRSRSVPHHTVIAEDSATNAYNLRTYMQFCVCALNHSLLQGICTLCHKVSRMLSRGGSKKT